jgi:hypothetical protein
MVGGQKLGGKTRKCAASAVTVKTSLLGRDAGQSGR